MSNIAPNFVPGAGKKFSISLVRSEPSCTLAIIIRNANDGEVFLLLIAWGGRERGGWLMLVWNVCVNPKKVL